jgi:hypothetical protein
MLCPNDINAPPVFPAALAPQQHRGAARIQPVSCLSQRWVSCNELSSVEP